MSTEKRQTIFSGIQPSGNLHIGHYFGAIKNWVELQDQYKSIFCIVDEHAITVPQDPKKLRERTLDIAAWYLALGIDPEKSTIFVQSHNQDHTELSWILNSFTPLGELYRMTQFKEKTKSGYSQILEEKKYTDSMQASKNDTALFIDDRSEEGKKKLNEVVSEYHGRRLDANMGLLDYPVLMAADILLYQTDMVPVGEDQKQHVELTRTLARKFNTRFGKTFKEPKELIREKGARIMSLQDPAKKMSKSDENKNSFIALLDSPDEIRQKIKVAVTDSGKEIVYEQKEKPAIANLITIYHLFSDIPVKEIEKKFKGKGYGDFKEDLGKLAIEKLTPFQEKYHTFKKNPEQVMEILHEGAKSAKQISSKTLADVKQKIGFL